MIKTTLEIDGMMCGMCESHVNDVIRKNFNIKKVNSSASKGETIILSDEAIDEALCRKVIGETGYEVTDVKSEPYEKKGLFGRLFG